MTIVSSSTSSLFVFCFFNVGLNNIPVKYSNWALLGFIFDIPAAYIYIIYIYCWWWIGAYNGLTFSSLSPNSSLVQFKPFIFAKLN